MELAFSRPDKVRLLKQPGRLIHSTAGQSELAAWNSLQVSFSFLNLNGALREVGVVVEELRIAGDFCSKRYQA